MKKYLPYFLLFFLTIFISFLFGVKYGRKVEKTDKYFYFMLSLTPNPIPSPTTNPYAFKLFNFKECKTNFVYPENLKIEKNKQSLKLVINKKILLEIICFREKPQEELKGKKIELKFKDRKIEGIEKNGFILFDYYSKTNSFFYRLKISPELYPLISHSISFEK